MTAGDYSLWRDDTTPVAVITINGGQVTAYRWPDSPERHGRLPDEPSPLDFDSEPRDETSLR